MSETTWRRFELRNERSSKFWEIRREGLAYRVRYGPIGTPGQERRKEFESEAACSKAADRIIAEKTRRGYAAVETADQASEQSDSASLGGGTVSVMDPFQSDEPASVRAVPPRAVKWSHPDEVAQTTAELEALGYQLAGHAEISGLAGCENLLFIHPDEFAYAILYEIAGATSSVWPSRPDTSRSWKSCWHDRPTRLRVGLSGERRMLPTLSFPTEGYPVKTRS